MSAELDGALAYASKGWRVVPIIPGRKHPPLDQWQTAATTDPATITQWWTGPYRGHGVGVATGKQSNLFVLDVDNGPGKNGDDTLADLETANGPLPDTFEVLTGGGGRHLYFRWPADADIRNEQAGRLGPGLDIRGEGGQVVAPPTVHPGGRLYAVEAMCSREVADAPAWLIDLLTKPAAATVARRDKAPRLAGALPGDRYAERHTWPELLEADGATYLDTRTERTTGHTYELWARPAMPGEDGYTPHTSATLYYKGSDVLKVFTSNWAVIDRDTGEVVTLDPEATYTRFGYYAATRHGGDHTAAARAIVADERPDWPPTLNGQTTATDTAPETPARAPKPLVQILSTSELLELPPFEPLIDDVLDRGCLSLLYGKYGSGKSFVALDWAISIALGRPWLGHPVHRGRVLYIAGEGSRGMQKRIRAYCTHYGIDPGDLEGWLHWIHRPVAVFDDATLAALAPLVIDLAPELIVIDTLAKSFTGRDENSTPDMTEYLHRLGTIGDAIEDAGSPRPAWLPVHHTGKDTSKGSRGSVALPAEAQSVLEMIGDAENGTYRLRNERQKDAAAIHDLTFRFRQVIVNESDERHSGVLEPVEVARPDRRAREEAELVRALGKLRAEHIPSTQGVASVAWRDAMVKADTVSDAKNRFASLVRALSDRGWVVNAGSGARPQWLVTESGEARLRDEVV